MKYNLEDLLKENMDIQERPSQELRDRILNQEKERWTMRNKNKYFKYVPKVDAAALAVVLATGGIAYAGTRLWDHYVAEDFGVAKNAKLQKELNEKGFAQQPQVTAEAKRKEISVTDKDITVTIQQTLADEHSAYVCYKIQYGDQYKAVDQDAAKHLDYGVAMPWTEFQMDSGIPLNYSGGVKKVIDDHTILYEYFITTSRMEDTLGEGMMKMSLSSFTKDSKKADASPEVVVKDGKWDLSWDLSVGTEKRVYRLDQTLTLGEYNIVLKDLTISPLSAKLTMENPEGVSLSDIGAVIRDTGEDDVDLREQNVIRYVRTGSTKEEHIEELNTEVTREDKVIKELKKGEMLANLDNFQLLLKGKDFKGTGGMGSVDSECIYEQFDKVLDMEKVTGIRVAGKYIDLKSASFETMK